MGGSFSLRCLSPLCSPAVGTGQTQRNASWDVSAEIGWLRSAKKRASFFLYNWHCTYSTNGAGMIRCCLDIFATQKASVISYPRWPFMRAMRPVAEWRSFLFNWRFATPNPRGPLPSGGNSAAKPHVPRVPTRPTGAVWGAGGHPLLRAMRPVAEWRSFLFNWRFTTPDPRGPLPSGGNSAANPHIPRVPRALWARCGVQGVTPCCEP